MIELRLYSAAFLPALLALIVAMFSLQGRAPGIPQALAADVLFQGKTRRGDDRSDRGADP